MLDPRLVGQWEPGIPLWMRHLQLWFGAVQALGSMGSQLFAKLNDSMTLRFLLCLRCCVPRGSVLLWVHLLGEGQRLGLGWSM